MKLGLRLLLVPLVVVLLVPPSRGAPPKEALVDQVKKAIDDGKKWLIAQQDDRGSWEKDIASRAVPGGWTALAMLALLQAGVAPEDPAIQKGLEYLRTIEPQNTYVVGLQTMVFCQADPRRDRELIQRNVDWLMRTRRPTGWKYTAESALVPDNSITQYALLGVNEAHLSGVKIDDKAFQEIRKFYMTSMVPDRDSRDRGGWTYRDSNRPSITMTTAGLCNLLIAGMNLSKSEAKLRADGSAVNCGVYEEDPTISRALNWLALRFPAQLTQATINNRSLGDKQFQHPFYALYGIERAGRLTGHRFLGGHDWYRVGCEYLVKAQIRDNREGGKLNGAWSGDNSLDRWPIVATSFSLLFLSKGRNPVLLTKLAFGTNPDSTGWNNKRNDVRHVVEFASKEIWGLKNPLAWQIFDIRRFDTKPEVVDQLTQELLQSPIVYLNGHTLNLSGSQIQLLKEYVANGGFIVAEACCGDERFTREFRKVIENDIVPGGELKPLSRDHPVWTASGKFKVPPGRIPLEGVEQGCKTVVMFSPKPLAGYWEINDYAGSAEGKMAFQLMTNIITYATGGEQPRPRLQEADFIRSDEKKTAPRGYLKVAQLKHSGDWQPAPRAMRNLMMELSRNEIEVSEATEAMDLTNKDLVKFKFLYLHGRNNFTIPDAQYLKELRFTLETGGVLLADAACGSKRFDPSFRELIKKLWPDKKLEKIDPETNRAANELLSKEVNGAVVGKVRCRLEGPDGKPDKEFSEVDPMLEGIKIKGRWVVIYSKYDLGCALEKHKSSDCLGYDFESARLLGKAVVLYALRR